MIKEMVKGEKEKMLERNLYIHNRYALSWIGIGGWYQGVSPRLDMSSLSWYDVVAIAGSCAIP